MCSRTCLAFVRSCLTREEVSGKSILEVGSMDVNGSARPYLESLNSASYLGVDIADGPSVDVLCDAGELADQFGPQSFDVVVSTEMVEHVRDWRTAFHQMKLVLHAGGMLLITTRSPGFKVHGYPFDYWRYTVDDMREILGDFDDLHIEEDSIAPGVFITARKPADWVPRDLSGLALYSVATRSRIVELSRWREAVFRAMYALRRAYRRILPERTRAQIKKLLRVTGQLDARQ